MLFFVFQSKVKGERVFCVVHAVKLEILDHAVYNIFLIAVILSYNIKDFFLSWLNGLLTPALLKSAQGSAWRATAPLR